MLYIVLLIFRILMFLNHFSDFGRGSDSQGGGKASIKTSIWFMQVMKLGVANTSAGEQPTFTMHYWLKEKKQKSKYILVFCFQNCSDLLWEKKSSDREKRSKFEAKGQEFAKKLRSLEQFIQTVKGQNNSC